MPGSWETHQSANVLCAILHVDVTTIAWALGLRRLQIPGQICPLAGMPYDMARNQACRIVLQNGFSHVFFLDSDVVAPPDAILRLLSHNQPIVSGLYCRRSPPHGVPVAIANGGWLTQLPARPSLIDVDYVGAGCLLIQRQVLEKFAQNPHPQRKEKLFFDWRVDAQELFPGQALSEDFTLCHRAKFEFGYRVLLDTSISCKHIGNSEVEYNSMKPLETIA